ncbi:MAG TPA: alpha/beta hydrolase [Thermodesulfobacteriota bacterium]|nr:alpha/beta hydrolase [Thermodesulfobacteriota bacterium]
MAYDDLGQGEPALLCLNGWCDTRRQFARLAPLLAARRRVLALDWRGHGESEQPAGEFSMDALVDDAFAVISASGAERVVPVAVSHSGWVAIELRRRLGARIPRLVLQDWLVLDPPQAFLDVLAGLQAPDRWRATREGLFGMWLAGVGDQEIARMVREAMSSYDFDAWARAAREIAAAYARHGSPLRALAALTPPVPALHLYAQPDDPAYRAAQEAFAAAHPWFRPRRLAARSHFPPLEVPDQVAASIEAFLAESGGPA